MTTYADVVMADVPFVYWKCNETTGTTIADSSGNGYDGTLSGDYTLGATALVTGGDGSLQIDTVVTDSGGFDTTTLPGSVLISGELLFNIEDVTECWFIDRWGFSTATNQYQLYVQAGVLKLAVAPDFGAAKTLTVTSMSIDPDTTYHVLWTIEASELKMYINGVLQTLSGFPYMDSVHTANSQMTVGRRTNLFAPILGRIDEVAFYTTSFTATDALVHYNASIGVFDDPVDPDAVPLEPLTEDVGVSAIVTLEGNLSVVLPPPVPPVDTDRLPDPLVAPTLESSDEVDGDLAPGTYEYAYAGYRGSEAECTAPSPWAEITLTTDNTVTLSYLPIEGATGYIVYRREV